MSIYAASYLVHILANPGTIQQQRVLQYCGAALHPRRTAYYINMHTNNHIDLIELPAASASQVQAVTAFFTTVFGWQFKNWGDDYSDTHDSGVAAGVNGSDTKEQQAPLAVIYVTNLEATKDKITAAGGTITHDITAFPGGRRFAFTDPAGNQLAAWSDK